MKTKCETLEYTLYYTYNLITNKFKIRKSVQKHYNYKTRIWTYTVSINNQIRIKAYSIKGLLYKTLRGLYKTPPDRCKDLCFSKTKLPINAVASLWLTVTQISIEEVDVTLIPLLEKSNIQMFTLKEVAELTKKVIGYDDFIRFMDTGNIAWTRMIPFSDTMNSIDIYDPINNHSPKDVR